MTSVGSSAIDPTHAIGKAAAKGMMWLLGQTFVSRGLQALTQIVLAWLLSPSDFGIIALALTVGHVVSTLLTFGFDDVLLQRRRGLDLWEPTLLWASFGMGWVACLAMVAVTPLVVMLYHQPELTGLLLILAITNPIGAFGIVPGTILRQRLDFRTLSIIAVGETVIQSVLSILLASQNFGAYAFILPMPVVAVFRVVFLWRLSRVALSRRPLSRRWTRLLPSASAALGTRLLGTARENGDYIILGILATAQEVGLYFFAFRVAVQPIRVIAQSFANVLFPALTKYRDAPARQAEIAFLVSQMLAIIVMPLCCLQAVLAEPVMTLVFDPRWHAAALIIALLTIGLGFDAVSWTAGVLLPSRGEFRRDFIYRLCSTPWLLVLVALGAAWNGAVGAGAGVALFYALVQPFYAYAVFRRGGSVRAHQLIVLYLLPACVGGACALAAFGLVHWAWPTSALLQIVLVPPLTLAAYVPLMSLLMPNACAELRSRIIGLLRK